MKHIGLFLLTYKYTHPQTHACLSLVCVTLRSYPNSLGFRFLISKKEAMTGHLSAWFSVNEISLLLYSALNVSCGCTLYYKAQIKNGN
jgi:hypothetical protein